MQTLEITNRSNIVEQLSDTARDYVSKGVLKLRASFWGRKAATTKDVAFLPVPAIRVHLAPVPRGGKRPLAR